MAKHFAFRPQLVIPQPLKGFWGGWWSVVGRAPEFVKSSHSDRTRMCTFAGFKGNQRESRKSCMLLFLCFAVLLSLILFWGGGRSFVVWRVGWGGGPPFLTHTQFAPPHPKAPIPNTTNHPWILFEVEGLNVPSQTKIDTPIHSNM